MSKNFHRDYAESVGHFCQSIPAGLRITTQEVDTYFRACALCLWACSEQLGGDVAGINQLYTDRQVKFSPQQFTKAISYYQSNPNYTVGVPEFSAGWRRPTPRPEPAAAAPLRRCRRIC